MTEHDNPQGRGVPLPVVFACLLGGACVLELVPALPGHAWLVPAFVVFVAGIFVRRLRFLVPMTAGFCLMWLAAATALADRLPSRLAGTEISIAGAVSTVPVESGSALQFRFAPRDAPMLPESVLLTWYERPYSPELGESWQLTVRLRQPRGLMNPGGFDYAGWLFRERIGATGYVVDDTNNKRLHDRPVDRISTIRRQFIARISRLLPAGEARAVMLAIGVGARHEISTQAWQKYATTGTSHLMAVSGLHVGLVFSSLFVVTWAVLGLFMRKRSVRDIALIVATIAALFYAIVAGFAVPSRRAFLMCALFAILILIRLRVRKWEALSFAGILVFVSNPISLLTPGFKMSFAAVAVIFTTLHVFQRSLHGMREARVASLVRIAQQFWRIQWYLLFGLLPLSIILFEQFTMSAPVANALILPLFNLVTVPFCLLGLLLDGPFEWAGDSLLGVAYASVLWVHGIVDWFAGIDELTVKLRNIGPVLMIAAWLSALRIILPPGWPGRRIAYIAVFAVAVKTPAAPAVGCLSATVLDAGQGLAVVLRTASHSLLFDTGLAYRSGGSVAQSVILPYLHRQGVDKIDRLVVSHRDIDHAGGLDYITRMHRIGDILAGEQTGQTHLTARPCRAGESWSWDGIMFEFLHPRSRQAWRGNNLSCVLQASAGPHSILLTGDIERPVELLLAYRELLQPVHTVVVPHHGSATSSSPVLTGALTPAIAIVSAAHGNRWGMPKADVVRRWQRAGAMVVNTAEAGAVHQQFCADRPPGDIVRERDVARRYWHGS